MTKTLDVLKKIQEFPKDLHDNIMYLVEAGSISYGVSTETSDIDVVGFVIPKKEDCFPHLAGYIPNFGTQPKIFTNFQKHHYICDGKEYDFSIYSIVKFFDLCMENNPNMVDVLFSPQRCVLYSNNISQIVRDNRKIFLHKGCYKKFRGYSLSQMHKIRNGSNSSNPKRKESIEKFGIDLKFLYHVVRLLLECEDILTRHDLDMEANSEILKAIRRGDWSLEYTEKWMETKIIALEELMGKSTLRETYDEEAIKRLLVECLETHYGSLDNAVVMKSECDGLAQSMFQLLRSQGYNF